MSEQHSDGSGHTPATAPAKRPWHAPTIEEIDYTETEAGGIPGGPYDGLGNYSII